MITFMFIREKTKKSKGKEDTQSIVKDVKRATVLTKEITQASTEQSEGISQVSIAVQQMDQVTQQTAASAEETASASEELAAQAQTMKEQINLLAIQVDGNGNSVQQKHKPANSGKTNVGKNDGETSRKMSEHNVVSLKTPGNIVFKLFSLPIYILKSIAKLRKRNDSNNGLKSGSMGAPERPQITMVMAVKKTF